MTMVIKKEQLDKEYIHFDHYLNGTVNAGVFKGWYDDARVIKFHRYFNRLELEIQNNNMYFDENNPLSRASDANVSTAILGSSQIVAEKEGKLLIAVDNLFLTEALHQITRGFVPGSGNKNPFRIGKLAKDRTKYVSL